VALLLLLRHGITDTTGKRLYGRQPGIHLSEEGRLQAARAAERLAGLPVSALYSSPLERCLETAEAVAAACGLEVVPLPGVEEADAGRWTGRSFASISRTKQWRLLHQAPSAARLPGGESAAEVQFRVVAALEEVAARHPDQAVVVVSHGDPICLAMAHFAGLHLDLFHRLESAPGSVSAVSLDGRPPRLLRLNDTGSLDDLRPPRRGRVRG
jgi:probable phosphomutase (TIGR03848 family)